MQGLRLGFVVVFVSIGWVFATAPAEAGPRAGADRECRAACREDAKDLRKHCREAGHPPHACKERARAFRAECSEGCDACFCPQVFDPVCGVDGVTYSNACEAGCAHTRIAHEGPCECGPFHCDLACDAGFARDADGCPICECAEPLAECRDDLDCPRGEVCELGGSGCDTPVCVSGCHTNGQCGADRVCEEVQCVTCPCPGVCADIGPDPECRSDADCARGEVCELGGERCSTPVCVPGCHADAQCAAGEVCTKVECVTCPCPGVCEAGAPDGACRDDGDCRAGEVCEPGGPDCSTPTCVAGCRDDRDCAGGQRCDEVRCVTCPCPKVCS